MGWLVGRAEVTECPHLGLSGRAGVRSRCDFYLTAWTLELGLYLCKVGIIRGRILVVLLSLQTKVVLLDMLT